jgi:LEM3 (ligand-effect modulator 3) family / CDC50 family
MVTPPYGVELNTEVCSLRFNIPNDIGPPVLLYYRLTNFYQNHRRYVKSLDTDQLLGKALDNGTIDGSACDPLTLNNETKKAYYPCGLVANSLFNDTINTPIRITAPGRPDGRETYPMANKGIAWNSDTELYKKTSYTRDQVEPPPNWRTRYPEGYTEENDIPDISKYEEFQVWMRTAGLPTFSKLALRNDNVPMRAGTYQIDIYDCKLRRTS